MVFCCTLNTPISCSFLGIACDFYPLNQIYIKDAMNNQSYEEPFVSVVIPVYNSGRYLSDSIQSALNQTLKNIEVIVVDDGSTDNSASVVHQFAEKDSRVRGVFKENEGVSSARNVGLEMARGEYVYFLDSDDYIDPSTLEFSCEVSQRNNLDIFYFDGCSFYENEKLEAMYPQFSTLYSRKVDYPEIIPGPEMFKRMQLNGDFSPHLALQLFKRSFLEKNQLRFYHGIIHQDNLFSFLSVMHAKRVKHTDKVFFNRRVRANSIMTTEISAKDVIGYLTCIAESQKFNSENRFGDLIEEQIKIYLSRMFENVIIFCLGLAKSEIEKIPAQLNPVAKEIFDIFVKPVLKITMMEEINPLAKTLSYKIGKKVTWLPRKIKTIAHGQQDG